MNNIMMEQYGWILRWQTIWDLGFYEGLVPAHVVLGSDLVVALPDLRGKW